MHKLSKRALSFLAISLLAAGALPWPAHAQDPTFDAPRATLAARVSRAIDTQVERLRGEPDATRAWLHDAIASRSYAGVLQGPLGAFLTGSGNDVDQALLLGLMLDRSMIRYRYASCQGTFTRDTDAHAPFAAATQQQVAQAIADAMSDPELRDAALSLPGLQAAMQADTDRAATRLVEMLQAHGIDVPATAASAPAAGRHTWVQMASGTDWLDLDTTTATGEPPCVPEETASTLPESLAHRLRVELDVEFRRGDAIRTAAPLSSEVTLATAGLSPITFAFGPPDTIGARIGEILEGRARYQPVLVVGDQVVAGTPIDIQAPEGGVTGGLLGPDDVTHEEATGAWLRFTLIAPDGSETHLTSEVFDRIGVAARDAGQAATEPLADLDVVDHEYAALATVWQLAVMHGPVVVPSAATDLSLTLAAGNETAAPIDAALRLYPSLVASLGGDPIGTTLLLAGVMPTAGEGGVPDTRLVLDALQVPGVPPVDGPSAARDAQAVLGAERALLSLLGFEPDPLGDAAAVFEAAVAAGIPWTVLRPGDTPDIAGASPDTNARIARHLDANRQVITPSSVPAIASGRGTAWWTVDPLTGTIRDEHESGRHQVQAEYSTQNARTVGYAERFRRFACRASRPIMLAATLFYFGSGFDPAAGELVEELLTVAEQAEENRRRGEEARGAACSGAGV